jgi:hypothetical protein
MSLNLVLMRKFNLLFIIIIIIIIITDIWRKMYKYEIQFCIGIENYNNWIYIQREVK